MKSPRAYPLRFLAPLVSFALLLALGMGSAAFAQAAGNRASTPGGPARASEIWTITATSGPNGLVTPAGVTNVNDGESQSYAITPDAGYAVQDVIVDDESVGPVTSYDFTNVTGDHTISASFTPTLVPAVVSAASPSGVVSPNTPSRVVDVNIAREYANANRLFHVKFQLGGGLTLTGGTAGITEGGFLTAHGASTSFQVVDNGGGSYTVDGTILGSTCNATDLSGNLFHIAVGSGAASGPGSVTITEVTLRDCGNYILASSIGSAASVAIDNAAPAVTVAAPNGGEFWVEGSTHDITWASSDAAGFGAGAASIDLSTDDGASWSSIATGLDSSGTYHWTVPASLSTSARVRVNATDANGNVGHDASDAVFTIAGATTVGLASDHNPSAYGQAVTFTATVTPSTVTGSVQFKVDGGDYGSPVALAGGVASSTALSSLAVGNHAITVVYEGDASYATGTGTLAGGQTVARAASSVAVVSDHNPSAHGQAVTFTATVTPVGASGTVQFKVDGGDFGEAVLLSDGSAISGSTASLATGNHVITAVYSGETNYTDGTGTLGGGQVVTAGASATAFVVDVNPSVAGDPVQLTATVTAVAPAVGVPTGTVRFLDDTTTVTTATLNGSGIATASLSSLAVGTHPLTAVYAGDASFATSTSDVVSQLVKAKIVASSGANGSVSPSGTILYVLNETPTYAFTADAGYHVDDVLLDGASIGPMPSYTFPAITANHTLAVSFAVNPPVARLTGLAVAQVKTGNDASGTTKVAVTWPSVGANKSVKVYRCAYGNYPGYDNAPNSGSVPPVPSYPPPSTWTLTSVGAPGDSDEVATRGIWYYVAFVQDQYGTISTASNRAGGALNYELGDVTDGATPGHGDNHVDINDLTLLGAHYGASGTALSPYGYLDVGPTTTHAADGRPMTDGVIDFEDLVMFAINYQVVSAPQAGNRPALIAAATDALELDVPAASTQGGITAHLKLTGTGAVQGLSAKLSWDPAVVAVESFAPGALLDPQGAVALSGRPGVVDIAHLGAGGGLVGSGEVAAVTFRRIAGGDPKIALASVDARNAANAPMAMTFSSRSAPVLPQVTSFDRIAPNPASNHATLSFALAKGGPVELAVYDLNGRLVRSLLHGARDAGTYQITWDGNDESGHVAAAGVYYARLLTPQGKFTRSLVYLR